MLIRELFSLAALSLFKICGSRVRESRLGDVRLSRIDCCICESLRTVSVSKRVLQSAVDAISYLGTLSWSVYTEHQGENERVRENRTNENTREQWFPVNARMHSFFLRTQVRQYQIQTRPGGVLDSSVSMCF